MELGVDARRDGGRRRGGANVVGLLDLPEVEKLPRDHALFAPPFIAIDQQAGGLGRAGEPIGRFQRAIAPAGVLNMRENEAGVAL